jgi:type IV pilus assembly protein PilE
MIQGRSTMKYKINGNGFSLIELMIVVVILAILVGLALPSYTRYVRKANRGEGQQLLLNWANNQEIWRANDADYALVTEIPLPTHDKYTFSLSNRGANTYTLTATATGDQAGDVDKGVACTPLTLNQSNAKTPAACW